MEQETDYATEFLQCKDGDKRWKTLMLLSLVFQDVSDAMCQVSVCLVFFLLEKKKNFFSAEFLKDWSFFAVFDGHYGAKVSEYCAEHLLESILQAEEFQRSDFVSGIRSGFLMLDSNMRTLPELASGEDKSGSTAVCAFISPKQVSWS